MQRKLSGRLKTIFATLSTIFSCLVLAGILYAVFMLPLRLNSALLQGMQVIKSDPAITETFGEPVRQSLIVMGTLRGFRYGDGVGNLETTIWGPKGSASAGFYMTKPQGGDWQLVSMSIHIGRKLALTWDADKAEKGFLYYQDYKVPTSSPTP